MTNPHITSKNTFKQLIKPPIHFPSYILSWILKFNHKYYNILVKELPSKLNSIILYIDNTQILIFIVFEKVIQLKLSKLSILCQKSSCNLLISHQMVKYRCKHKLIVSMVIWSRRSKLATQVLYFKTIDKMFTQDKNQLKYNVGAIQGR